MSSGNTTTHKHTTDEIKTLLELPFRAAEITWRVLGDGERTEGETRIIPYAYRAAYMRRLDILFGPGGWTQSFSMTTVSNIQRSKKVNKAYAMITTGKIIVTSTITIEGFGTKSSTGEGWADDENGTTRAQAQAFRRACAEFGLGRYLRELEGWNCKVPVNAKGYFKRPHFSVLPDSAIHPSELAEAQEVRSRTAKSSRKPPAPATAPPAQNRGLPASRTATPVQGSNQPIHAAASSPQAAPEAATATHVSGFAPQAQAVQQTAGADAIEAQLAVLRTPEVKQRLTGYLDQLSKSLITSVVTGVSELHANGRMKGSLINDVFFNLDRAVDLMDGINNMEPMLPNDNSLPSILHSHSARTLSDLQTFGDLKAVSRTVTTIYQAEQERQHGTTAA
jgi:hypothetical protein